MCKMMEYATHQILPCTDEAGERAVGKEEYESLKWGFGKKAGRRKKRNAMQQGQEFVRWCWRMWRWRYGAFMTFLVLFCS